MKAKAYINLLIALLIVSHCSFYKSIRIQAAESADLELESAQTRMSSASRFILATWVNKIKSRRLAKDGIHKVPSGPNPIGNLHPPLKP